MLEYNAKVLIKCKGKDGRWSGWYENITSPVDVRNILTAYVEGRPKSELPQDKPIYGVFDYYSLNSFCQVHVSKYLKVYYGLQKLEQGNPITAKCVDMFGEKVFMSEPLILVECSDTHPVNISNEGITEFENVIEFL